jgi:hypothetical protein
MVKNYKGDQTMNKIRFLTTIFLLVLILTACSFASTPQATQPPTAEQQERPTFLPQSTYTALSTYTPPPTNTPEPTVVVPSPTPEAKPINLANTQWSGGFRGYRGRIIPVTLIIQNVIGSKFEGDMYWLFNECNYFQKVDGDIYKDITTAPEQERWAFHPDFISGDRSGTWLRWTQSGNISSKKCYPLYSGDWWYAHINIQGHMTGIHFTNTTNTVPDTGETFDLELKN